MSDKITEAINAELSRIPLDVLRDNAKRNRSKPKPAVEGFKPKLPGRRKVKPLPNQRGLFDD